MNVNMYYHAKRENSTSRPTGDGTVFTCMLKDGTSVMAPVIEIKWTGSGTPLYNYAYINAFSRYYFVDDWRLVNRIWEAHLRVDVLATYKATIGNSTRYVLRSASSSNADAVDNLYPAVCDFTSGRIAGIFSDWAVYGPAANGAYVITTIGDNSPTSAVCQFQVSPSTLQAIQVNAYSAIDNEYNSFNPTSPEEAIKLMLLVPTRFFADPAKFMGTVRWFPFKFAEDSGPAVQIHLGPYPMTAVASHHPIYTPLKHDGYTIDLSTFGGSGKKWEWLAPYCTYTLAAQPWGMIPLDPNDMVNGSNLFVTHDTDSLSGMSKLEVYVQQTGESDRLIASRTVQLGIDVPFGGAESGGTTALVNGLASGVGAVAAAYGEGGVAGMIAAVGSAAASSSPSGYMSGTAGGAAAIPASHYLYWRKLGHVDEDPAEKGYPLCESVQISTLSGFIMCQDGDIQSAIAYAPELAEVKSYLEGGFFYE